MLHMHDTVLGEFSFDMLSRKLTKNGCSLHLPTGLMDPLKTYQHDAQNVLRN